MGLIYGPREIRSLHINRSDDENEALTATFRWLNPPFPHFFHAGDYLPA